MTRNINVAVAITAAKFAADLNAATLAKASAIFEAVDNSSASFAAKLTELGLGTRALAMPFAKAWAAQKYSCKLEPGQRGWKLPRDSAADKACQRVLNAVYPSEASVFAGAGNRSADPVARLVKAYGKLTGAQKRSFMAQIGK